MRPRLERSRSARRRRRCAGLCGILATLLIPVAGFAQLPAKPIGEIELFGYQGLNVESLKAGLPIREGELFPPVGTDPEALKARIGDSVRQLLGRPLTDLRVVCCDDHERWMIYLGLPGASYRPVSYNEAPSGRERLPPEVVRLQRETDEALQAAVLSGNAGEDDSQGYALSNEPKLRAKQLALREYALGHEAELLGVLARSADAQHRAIAAAALGYARRSDRQIAALVSASLDADDGVRNDAARALAVLAGSDSALAKAIPASSFVRLLASGIWTDHNKGAAVLEALSRGRDEKLLRLLRAEALDNLIEMARWRSAGHSATARMIVGRIAGIEEQRLQQLVWQGQVDAIVAALDAGSRAAPECR